MVERIIDLLVYLTHTIGEKWFGLTIEQSDDMCHFRTIQSLFIAVMVVIFGINCIGILIICAFALSFEPLTSLVPMIPIVMWYCSLIAQILLLLAWFSQKELKW